MEKKEGILCRKMASIKLGRFFVKAWYLEKFGPWTWN